MGMPTARTVPAVLDELAALYPDHEALVDGGRRWTFPAMREAVQALARGLLALGVRKGDAVAIWMGNKAEWILMDFAITSIGAVMVGVNTWSTAREIEYVLSHAEVTVLITADRFLKSDFLAQLDALRPWTERLPALRHVVVVGEGGRPDTMPFARLAELGKVIPADAARQRAAAVMPDDVAYILYTSGSTAAPKGVMIQHAGLIENLWNIGERLGVTDTDRLWLAVSLFWALGCENALFAALTHGACVILQEAFDAGEALRIIEAERCSVLYGTPNMVQALLEHPDYPKRDVSSLRTGATIGTPEQMLRLIRNLAPHACQVYGMTEVFGNCTVCDWRDPEELRATTCGKALPGVSLRVVDPDTEDELPAGTPGELRVKGFVMAGYFKDPERTAAAFDADGWFKTGDLCALDQNGNLLFRGRMKEMVKTGGINVAPAEVEDVLRRHPDVEDAFVIGLPDEQRDEIVAAVIIPREGRQVTEADILAHCRRQMAAYKAPRRIVFAAAADLPLTVTGKLQKNRLHTLFPT